LRELGAEVIYIVFFLVGVVVGAVLFLWVTIVKIENADMFYRKRDGVWLPYDPHKYGRAMYKYWEIPIPKRKR